MIAGKVSGRNVSLAIKEAAEAGGVKVWGCCRQLSINGNTEMLEITPITGRNLSFLPTYHNTTIQADGLYLLFNEADTSKHYSKQLWDWRLSHTRITFVVRFADEAGVTFDTYTGEGYIVATNSTGNDKEAALMNISIQVAGGILITGGAFSIVCPVVNWSATIDTLTAVFSPGNGAESVAWEFKDGTTVVASGSFLVAGDYTPREIEATGLDADTNYTLTLTHNGPGGYIKECNYNHSTAAVPQSIIHNISWGSDAAAACFNYYNLFVLPVYSTSSVLQVGVRLFKDAALTQPLDQQWVTDGTNQYEVNTITGDVVALIGTCPPP